MTQPIGEVAQLVIAGFVPVVLLLAIGARIRFAFGEFMINDRFGGSLVVLFVILAITAFGSAICLHNHHLALAGVRRELSVVSAAHRLHRLPPAAQPYLATIRVGRRLDNFDLRHLQRIVSAEHRREAQARARGQIARLARAMRS